MRSQHQPEISNRLSRHIPERLSADWWTALLSRELQQAELLSASVSSSGPWASPASHIQSACTNLHMISMQTELARAGASSAVNILAGNAFQDEQSRSGPGRDA